MKRTLIALALAGIMAAPIAAQAAKEGEDAMSCQDFMTMSSNDQMKSMETHKMDAMKSHDQAKKAKPAEEMASDMMLDKAVTGCTEHPDRTVYEVLGGE
ncbi:MAG: hypothetical protein O3A96_04270 [Proteobacteria bacterium]|nr:hypothetical protein [Pseudomonadota bacterium]